MKDKTDYWANNIQDWHIVYIVHQSFSYCNAEPIYEIASPLYEKVVIDLGKRYNRGETFTIEAKNVSRHNKYIQSATLNGEPLYNFCFPASELLKGGQLVLQMGDKPNRQWGISSGKHGEKIFFSLPLRLPFRIFV
ncbi:MAG: glycoside hydrolase domain-containing protein [Prevotella sp.]